MSCLFCDVQSDWKEIDDIASYYYDCPICGRYIITRAAADDFASSGFSKKDKLAITITLRNAWERDRRTASKKPLNLEMLRQIAEQFRPLGALDKMDYALLRLEKLSEFAGSDVRVDWQKDYPLYYCGAPGELRSVCEFLELTGYVTRPGDAKLLKISPDGYRRLREIAKPNVMSRQCFVAMWFTDDMAEVYEKAIRPAIEFLEPEQKEPRFRAVKIDNVEHINDINDEIIAQIRRSRFMVCDLTGYRGGVYFEAGFAYGLGLEVVYTCRKDWAKEEILKDSKGKEVKILFDGNNKEVPVKKEGVHFDLAHRNRIEWEPGKLDEFKAKLETRIKSLF